MLKKKTPMKKTGKPVSKKQPSKAVIKVLAEKPFDFTRLENKEWYPAKLADYRTGDGKFGEWISLEFEITGGKTEDDEDASEVKVSMFTNLQCAPETPLYDAITVLAGEAPEVDDEVDITAYFGKRCKVFIEDRKPKKGVPPDGRQNVTGIKALVLKKNTSVDKKSTGKKVRK